MGRCITRCFYPRNLVLKLYTWAAAILFSGGESFPTELLSQVIFSFISNRRPEAEILDEVPESSEKALCP